MSRELFSCECGCSDFYETNDREMFKCFNCDKEHSLESMGEEVMETIEDNNQLVTA